jgi:hypothetical protein
MSEETEKELFKLLDVLSIGQNRLRDELRSDFRSEFGGLRSEIGGLRLETGGIRSEMRAGFDRVERRLGRVETRVELLEDSVREQLKEHDRRITALEQ